jgi:hypothetical protein
VSAELHVLVDRGLRLNMWHTKKKQ